MTSTIRDTDITILKSSTTKGYLLSDPESTETRRADTYAEALQVRADIIDMRARAARVGDIVRIGTGRTEYRVDGFDDTARAVLYPTEVLTPAQSRVRRVECERLHVVEAVR